MFTRLHAEAADCGLAATLSLSLPFRLPLPLIVATAMDRATLPRGATGKWGTFIYLTLSLSIYIYIHIQATPATSPSTTPGSAVLLHMFIICVSNLLILYVSGGTGLPALLLAVLRALSMSVLGSALVLMALDTSSTSVVLALVDIGSTGSDILALDTGALVLPLPVPFLPLRLPLPLIVATAMDRATLPRGATGKWGTFIYLTFSLSIYIYI